MPASRVWTLPRIGLALLVVSGLVAPSVHAAELQPRTLEAFEQYIDLTQARIDSDMSAGHPFLWVDAQPDERRQAFHAQLRRGDVVIEPLQTRDAGREIDCPDGMIHHWIATTFVRDVTLAQVLALVQDYDDHENIYRPDVQRSKLLHRDGDHFQVFLRLHKRSLVTVVLNTEHDVRYVRVSAHRAHSRGYATRIAQVENAGTPHEREKPVGNDSGYLWRLHNYWRFEERDGGVYLQSEAVALTRDIPWAFRWLVGPLVSRIPREALRNLLGATRNALLAPSGDGRGTAG
jgi:hypothetical protein